MTIALITIQVITFITYISYIYSNYGVLKSISDSTYALPNGKQYYFTIFCWLIALPIFIQGFGMIGALAASGLLFTGVTTDHNSNRTYTRIVHMIGAISAIGLMFFYMVKEGDYGIPIMFIISILPFIQEDNRIWWIECSAFFWIIVYIALVY